MTVRKQVNISEGRFYISTTCFKWLSLFDIINGYDIVYKQFDLLIAEGHSIIGYVIMPNHLHFIVDFQSSVNDINKRIGTIKRFMAYEIVQRLQTQNNIEILNVLEKGVSETDRKKGKLHKVFEPSFDIKQCLNNAFTEQKLNYIHNNPCKGKWRLSQTPEAYIHSSAAFYNLDVDTGIYKVTHYLAN